MDIILQDPSEVPLPPSEVRIRELKVEQWPGERKVRVYLEVTPFQKRPNVEMVITDGNDREVGAASIIESMSRKMEITMHLRNLESADRFRLSAQVFYSELPTTHSQDEPDRKPGLPSPMIVDQRTIPFELMASRE
jgi:hypothetical protein